MGRKIGLAQQGAWGCFDEVQQIRPEILSAVTQQVLSIYSALAAGDSTLVVGGNKDMIPLATTCAVFVTTTCSGGSGGGGSELPDNFATMFRNASVMVPDGRLIAETMLFADGFSEAKCVAGKLTALISLCAQLLGQRHRYEFGLRSLVELVKCAGKRKRDDPARPDDEVKCLSLYR